MSRKLARTLTLAVVLPLVLLALTATSFASWRCQLDGVARSACCCAKAKAAHDSQGPSIARKGCCALERVQIQRAPLDVSRSPSLAPLVVGLDTVLAWLEPPAPARAGDGVPAVRPPGGGRSLVLQKHAFLI
jgi:hypothetical protein